MTIRESAEELRKCGYIFRSLNNGTHLVIETLGKVFAIVCGMTETKEKGK